MGSYNAWIGKKVKFEGLTFTVVGVDYNGGLLIDPDTAVDESMVELIEEAEPEVPFCGSADGYEVEYCNVCEREIELRWDINRDGFQAVCPVCGSRLMLCDACQHRFGEHVDDCDYTLPGPDRCRFSRPKNWWKEE